MWFYLRKEFLVTMTGRSVSFIAIIMFPAGCVYLVDGLSWSAAPGTAPFVFRKNTKFRSKLLSHDLPPFFLEHTVTF
jgi:hypothetical protein